jgi:hypothetical protein
MFVALLSVVAIVGWLVVSAGGGSAAATADYERTATFDHQGFSIDCTPSSCPVPIVIGMPFTFQTLGASYEALVTISFTYKTSAGLRTTFAPVLDENGSQVNLPNSIRYLPPAPKRRSVTLTWLIPSLTGGQAYTLFPSAEIVGTPSSYNVSYTDITVAVEGAPA